MTGKAKPRKRTAAAAKTTPAKSTNDENALIIGATANTDAKNQFKKNVPKIAAHSEEPTKKRKKGVGKRQIMEETENCEVAPQEEAASELHRPPSRQVRRAKINKKNPNEATEKVELPENSSVILPAPTEGNYTNGVSEEKHKLEADSKLDKNTNKRGGKKKAQKSEDENHSNTAEGMKEERGELASVDVKEETPGEIKRAMKRTRRNKNDEEFKHKSTLPEDKEPIAKTRKKLARADKNKKVQKLEHENANASNEPIAADEENSELASVNVKEETKQRTKRARQSKNNEESKEKNTSTEGKEPVAKTGKKLSKKNNGSQKPEHENPDAPKEQIATDIKKETSELTKPTKRITKKAKKINESITQNEKTGGIDVNTDKMTKQSQDPKTDVSSDDDFEIEKPTPGAKKVTRAKASRKPASSSASSSKEEKGPKPANRSILQLKIILRDITPPIYRRIQVLNNDTFFDLHNHIHEAMGWNSNHSHQFIVFNPKTDSNILIVNGSLEGVTYDFSERHLLKEQTTKLSKFLSAKDDRLLYEYDLGDSWIHEVVVEKILPPPPPKAEYPKCTGGKRACPPEDCGGVDGYNHLLEVYKNPNHEEYEELINDWLGEFNPGWDPEKFDKKNIFRRIRMWMWALS